MTPLQFAAPLCPADLQDTLSVQESVIGSISILRHVQLIGTQQLMNEQEAQRTGTHFQQRVTLYGCPQPVRFL